jgi:hypothetical protein
MINFNEVSLNGIFFGVDVDILQASRLTRA